MTGTPPTYQDLPLAPGFITEQTPRGATGRYKGGDKVRFKNGRAQKLGGWNQRSLTIQAGWTTGVVGHVRAIHEWTSLDGQHWIAIGTEYKVYLINNNNLYDVTPLKSGAAGTGTLNNPFSVVQGFGTVVVAHAANGEALGDFVSFSGVSAVGGITAAQIQNNTPITSVSQQVFTVSGVTVSPTAGAVYHDGASNTYLVLSTSLVAGAGTITTQQVGGSAAVPASGTLTKVSGTGDASIAYSATTTSQDGVHYTISTAGTATSTVINGGGNPVTYFYEIDIPPTEGTTTGGWGIGTWGSGPWGRARKRTEAVGTRIWSLDNWGQDLILSPRGGAIYTWVRANGTGTRATLIATAPLTANRVLVSPQSRQLIVLGGYDFDNLVQNQSIVQWSDESDYTDFTPSPTNAAGANLLDGGSYLLTGLRTRGGMLLFTNESLYFMQFVGGNDIFSFTPQGESVAIISPNAAVDVNGTTYFMAVNDFYLYNGNINVMPCEVREYVFNNINLAKADKVYASVNRLWNEVWWFYPSASAVENDSYVVYNFVDQCWSFGFLDRTAFHDYGPSYSLPYAFDENGVMYLHEQGTDANGQAMLCLLETWDIELDPGDEMTHVSRIVPDFLDLTGSVQFYLDARRYPQSAGIQKFTSPYQSPGAGYVSTKGPYTVVPTTEKIDTRARGRQVSIRMQSSNLGDFWRMGTWRAMGRPDGRR